MTLPASGPISVSQINTEIGLSSTYSSSLNFLNGYVLPAIRPTSPNMANFYNRAYYKKTNSGNCSNGNCNCNCNCGNTNCINCQVCTTINCVNCDSQAWLQNNCNCACTYNCNTTGTWTTNCACDCVCDCACVGD